MKVVAVLGSPRPNGGSATVARRVLDGARDAGHEVVVYEINKMNVRGCQACRTCKSELVDCVLQDDLQPYWKDLHACGALLVSACNYCSMINGPMVTFMNRHYCLIGGDGKVRVHPGIKLVGVFSQGNPDASRIAQVYDWFLGDFQHRDMVLVDKLVHSSRMPEEQTAALMERAYETGLKL
jgi:multimeric flavodoxin WrbA